MELDFDESVVVPSNNGFQTNPAKAGFTFYSPYTVAMTATVVSPTKRFIGNPTFTKSEKR